MEEKKELTHVCRVCGLRKQRKEFRKVMSLRKQKQRIFDVWCKVCQKEWIERNKSGVVPLVLDFS